MSAKSSNFTRDDEAADLFALQLRIARKADELVRQQGMARGLNLHCWLLAEAEVLADGHLQAQPREPQHRDAA